MSHPPDAASVPPPEPDELERIRALVERRAGLVLEETRGRPVDEAVREAAAELGLGTVSELVTALLKDDDRAHAALVSRLTVRETYFFRNRPHFRALREVLLPELLERARGRKSLRIWSAGCSTGEEPYSLAVVLLEAAEKRGLPLHEWKLEVLGTDINEEVLEIARRGVYGKYSFRGVEDEEIARHFEPEPGGGHRVAQRYRELVRFGSFNLKSDLLPNPGQGLHQLDLIVCRNVTIYFSTETTQRLADRFWESLREGGYLIVGHSEHSLETYRRFETHALPDAILYRRGGEGSLRSADGRDDSPIGQALHALRSATAIAPDLLRRARELDRRGGAPALPRPGSGGPAREQLPVTLEAAREALGTGDLDRAVAVAVEVLEKDPKEPDATLLLGELAADRGHAAEAEVWLRRTLELRPLDLTAHYVLALLAAERGEAREALDHLGRALYVDPDFLMGHYLSLRLHREAGRAEAAERSRRTALRICAGLADDAGVPFAEGIDVRRFRALIEEPGS